MFLPVYNRGTDSVNQSRLTAAVQVNQKRLQALQQQIATGQRITRLSQDPHSGIRAVGYQAAIDRATQHGRNLQTNHSFLSASETQLRSANNLLSQIRGDSVAWANSALTDADRQTALQQLHNYREQLLSIANTQFQGRYLFAGANTGQAPFNQRDGRIEFLRNQGQIKLPTTTEILLQSNISAQRAFGGQSSAVVGTPGLQAPLTPETRLSDLRLGQGVQSGTIEISDGSQTSLIDLKSAETVGDVIRLIEAQPPLGRHLKVEIKGDRLELRLSDQGSELLMVREANGGTMAADLGIRTGLAETLPRQIVGQGLSPQLSLTTPLDRLQGSPAMAYLASPGHNNDLVFRARQIGSAENGLTLQYVDSSKLQAGSGLRQGSEQVFVEAAPRAARAGLAIPGAGNDLQLQANQPGAHLNGVRIEFYVAGSIGNLAVASFDSHAKVLSIGIDAADGTTAQALIDAIQAEGTFTAAGDVSDPANGAFDPAAVIASAAADQVTGDTGNSGGDANTVYIHVNPELSNAFHVLSALQKNATLTERFEISLDPTDGPPTPRPGTHLIDPTARATTTGGSGSSLDLDAGFQITVGDQTRHVSLVGAQTVEDLINAVQATNLGVYAQISPQRNGLVLGIRTSGVTFSIGESGGTTATQLGLRTLDRVTRLSNLNFGQGVTAQPGIDFTLTRSDGSAFDVDVSGALSVGDVLDRINNHPDNQDPNNRIVARLAPTGNGIEVTQDNPTGSLPISVRRQFGSRAAEELGLVPRGQDIGYPAAAQISHARLDVRFAEMAGLHRSFAVRANLPGNQYNLIDVEIVSGANGDQATTTYDALLGRLTIQIDPGATRTSTLVESINQTGLFRGELLTNADGSFNNGAGIVTQLGHIGRLSGGNSQPTAIPATAVVRPQPPHHLHTAINVTANQPGTGMDGYAIIFQSGAAGDAASAAVDPVLRQLVVTIDPAATTANTIVAAIQAEGTFTASLNTDVDPTNNGTGLFAQQGTLAVTSGGAPEVLRGADVHLQENESIFNTIDRMIWALGQPDAVRPTELQRAAGLLELDIERLSQAMVEAGTRLQYNDFLTEQNEELLIELKSSLAEEMEVDMVEAISQLTAQQTSVEASLRMVAQTFRTTLLDFI
jgi:flagellin-like hook-associated protein FlgL